MRRMDVYVVEEHHEAFIAWHHALKKGSFQAARKSTLLHVDSHSDMAANPFRRPIPELSAPLEDIREFTYSELRIGTFIIPAIYQKLFYEVCWLVPEDFDFKKHGMVPGERKCLYARTYKERRLTLLVNDDPFGGFSDKPWQDRAPFCCGAQTVRQPFSAESTVVLDIDLDYFACSRFVDASQRLEITREEYRRCKSERYRMLNLYAGYALEEADGRCYLWLNPGTELNAEPREDVPREKVLASIRAFIAYLKDNRIAPAFVTLCRSRHSGFTPRSAWRFIEDEVMKGLAELYPLDVLQGADALTDAAGPSAEA